MQKLFRASLVGVIGLAMPISMALADNVDNQIDNSVDATVENINLTAGGFAVVIYKTDATKDDGENGCNLNNGESVTFNLVNSNPSAATLSTSTITFTGPNCNDTEAITVTGVAAGTTTISLTQGANTTGGTYTLNTATFTVNVSPAVPVDVTPPVITPSVTPAAVNGWNNTDVTVMWTIVDAQSSFVIDSGCVNQTLTGETLATILTCSATSEGGTSNSSVTVKIDKTLPIISGVATPPAVNGWNSTPVSVNFTCSDVGAVQSDIDIDTVNGDDEVLGEGAGQSVASDGDCIDNAGNTAIGVSVDDINVDMTKPVIAGVATPGPNGFGWNNTDVDVNFTCSDTGSILVTDDVALDDDTLSAEGAGQSVTSDGDCVDSAGNVADQPVAVSVSIDKTDPEITLTTPAEGDQYVKDSPVNANWSVTDALSGVNSGSVVATTPNGSLINTSLTGAFLFSVSASDLAGNAANVSHNYTVFTYVFKGFQTPLTITSKEFKQMSTIPVKFQLLNSITGLPVPPGPSATLTVNNAPAKASGGSNVGNNFRYDVSGGQYIYNLSTKLLNTGGNTLKIQFTGFGSPAEQVKTITIK
jgi:hypothetical protein